MVLPALLPAIGAIGSLIGRFAVPLLAFSTGANVGQAVSGPTSQVNVGSGAGSGGTPSWLWPLAIVGIGLVAVWALFFRRK
jgi:hypothetical protein